MSGIGILGSWTGIWVSGLTVGCLDWDLGVWIGIWVSGLGFWGLGLGFWGLGLVLSTLARCCRRPRNDSSPEQIEQLNAWKREWGQHLIAQLEMYGGRAQGAQALGPRAPLAQGPLKAPGGPSGALWAPRKIRF